MKQEYMVILGKSRWCSKTPCSASVTNPDTSAKIHSYFGFGYPQNFHGKCTALTLLLLHSPPLADITNQPQYSYFPSVFSTLRHRQSLPINCHWQMKWNLLATPVLETPPLHQTWTKESEKPGLNFCSVITIRMASNKSSLLWASTFPSVKWGSLLSHKIIEGNT